MIIQKLSTEEFYSTHEDLIVSPEVKVIYTIHDVLKIDYGYENDCNIDWCNENNIPVTYFNRGGGCIVNCPGNITLVYVIPFNNIITPTNNILNNFIEFLKTKNVNTTCSRNDIMIDGFKVASGICRWIPSDFRWRIGGIQISINQDLDIIKHACKKPMLKIPKGLSEFGVTTEDIESWIKDYFKDNWYNFNM